MAQRSITEPNYHRAGVNNSGSDIASKLFLQQDTNADEVDVATAPTDTIVGVSVETIKDGKSQSYQYMGRCPITAGGAVSVGARVTTDSQGRAVAAATGNFVKGIALTEAGQADDVFDIELWPGMAVEPA